MSLFEINYLFFSNQVIFTFFFVIKISVYYSPGGKFFTPFFVIKLLTYPGFSYALSETLRTYTFSVKSRNAILVFYNEIFAVNTYHFLSQFL